MNNGAFGENFPYSNFHDLNMDWIIKIAKDFLDQYTHIQETIENGLDALDEKATNLEALLQEWYDTHSEDIAEQLASALQDLNDWYTTHQNYLEQTLIDAKADFDTHAEEKAQETIASIPTDYSNLVDLVSKKQMINYPFFPEIAGNSIADSFVVDENAKTLTMKAGLAVWTGTEQDSIVVTASDYVLNLGNRSKIFLYNNNGTIELYQCTNGSYATIDHSIREKIITQIAETNANGRIAWTLPVKTELLANDLNKVQKGVSRYSAIIGHLTDTEETTTGLAKTRRWFLANKVPANSMIESIAFQHDGRSSESIYLEFWRVTGDTLTKVETMELPTSNIDTAGSYYMPINKQFPYDVYIGFSGTGTVNFNVYPSTGVGLLLASTTNSPSATSIVRADLINYPNYTVKMNVSAWIFNPYNVVYVGQWERYQTIQEALEDIDDDSATNPYTIYVMPQGKPYPRFSMIRGLNDSAVYTARLRYISIIGMDREHCIIQDDSGNYDTPPAELLTTGIIKNLTFIATHDKQDPLATKGGYCAHIDCGTIGDIGYKMFIEDCTFEDDNGPCLGIGMRQSCTLTIRRCTFKTTLDSSYSPHEGYRNLANWGCVYCHNGLGGGITGQNFIMEDCYGTCRYGNKSLYINKTDSYGETDRFKYTLHRNIFWNIEQNAPAYDISTGLIADPTNFGNNIP